MDFNNLDLTKILGLDKLEKLLGRLEKTPLKLYSDQCSSKRGDQERSCRLCVNACPTGAVTLIDEIKVDFSRCNGCGFCANVCPSGVFEPLTTDDYLLAHIKPLAEKDGLVAFKCPRAPKEDRAAVELFCLGRLNEVLVVGAAAFGADRLWMNTGACAACELATAGLPAAEKAVDAGRKLSAAFGRSLEVEFCSELPSAWRPTATPEDLAEIGASTRREFFSSLYRQAYVGGAELVSQRLEPLFAPAEKLPFGYRLPRRRELLLMLLKKLGRPKRERLAARGLDFTALEIDDNCVFCGNCVLFCPTQALTENKDAERGEILFTPANCTRCNLCKVICPTRSISFHDDIALADIVDERSLRLIDYQTAKCKKCQQPFGTRRPGRDICPFCAQREAKLKDDAFS